MMMMPPLWVVAKAMVRIGSDTLHLALQVPLSDTFILVACVVSASDVFFGWFGRVRGGSLHVLSAERWWCCGECACHQSIHTNTAGWPNHVCLSLRLLQTQDCGVLDAVGGAGSGVYTACLEKIKACVSLEH